MKNFLYKRVIVLFLSLFVGNSVIGQVTKTYAIGDIANETFEVYDTNKVAVKLKVPSDNGYLIVHNYRWVNAGRGIDNEDSLKLLEQKMSNENKFLLVVSLFGLFLILYEDYHFGYSSGYSTGYSMGNKNGILLTVNEMRDVRNQPKFKSYEDLEEYYLPNKDKK